MAVERKENPFQISYAKNEIMGGYDVMLQVGALKDEEEAKAFGEALSEWMTQEGGWKQHVQ